jgi:DNA-binding transcriptional LysR family regulator
MDWNWDHLRFFLALARGATLTRAAERLGVSHTTVLRRIRQFEGQLDTHLFDRTPDGWLMTQAGERLLAEVEQMEQALGTISREIVGADHRLEGPVVIATNAGFAMTLLPDALRALKQRHPGLELSVKVGKDLVDLGRREADVALRITDAPPESLVGRRVGWVQLAPVASRAYLDRHGLARTARLPERPDGQQFVLLPWMDTPLFRWVAPHRNPGAATFVDCKLTALALARGGLGIAEVPSVLLQGEPEMVQLETPWEMPARAVWLLSNAEARSSARIRATTALLAEALAPRLGQPGSIAA